MNAKGRTLRDVITLAGHEMFGYTGRGMSGQPECVAFTPERNGEGFVPDMLHVGAELMAAAFDIGLEEFREMNAIIRGARTDAMGLGTVVYFPRYPFEESAR